MRNLIVPGPHNCPRAPPGTLSWVVSGRPGPPPPPETAWDTCPRDPPATPRDTPKTLSRDPPGTVVFNILNASVVLVCLVCLGFCLVFASAAANPNSRRLRQTRFFVILRGFVPRVRFFISNAYSKPTAISDFLGRHRIAHFSGPVRPFFVYLFCALSCQFCVSFKVGTQSPYKTFGAGYLQVCSES